MPFFFVIHVIEEGRIFFLFLFFQKDGESRSEDSGLVVNFLEGLSVFNRWKFEAITGL